MFRLFLSCSDSSSAVQNDQAEMEPAHFTVCVLTHGKQGDLQVVFVTLSCKCLWGWFKYFLLRSADLFLTSPG